MEAGPLLKTYQTLSAGLRTEIGVFRAAIRRAAVLSLKYI